MDWIATAKELFKVAKPKHFTNYQHCCECYEHDQTLLNHDLDFIGFEELGNPGWDPICFVEPIGFMYYFPALVRLCIQSNCQQSYLDQFLFHLIYDGKNNRYVNAFNQEQREFIVQFLTYLIESKAELIEQNGDVEDLFHAIEIWQV